MAGYETILFDVADSVATITLHRPERRNAWTGQMGQELSHALTACDLDDGVRVVVLTGAGDAFCAGADLERGGDTFAGRQDGGGADGAGEGAPRLFLPHQVRKPVIAAINGHAVGVGITYPLLCDVRFVAAEAKIAFAFVRRGMMPELASHVVLARVVGLSNAADLLLSGRTISGAEAAAVGLASRALPAAEVLPAAVAWAQDVARNVAPVSAAITKHLLWDGLNDSVAVMARREDGLFNWLGNQADAGEGVTSFLERRAPQWRMSPTRDLPPLRTGSV